MNHLTSQQVQEIIDGTVTNEMELHLRTCSICQSNVSAFRKLDRTLRSMAPENASTNFTERVMRQAGLPELAERRRAGIEQSSSFAWMLLKNLAPLIALTLVVGIALAALKIAGAFQDTGLAQSVSATQTVSHQLGSSVDTGIQALNGWVAKYFSFAFAKNTYGLTAFILIFFGVIAVLDKYILMPMMKKRV